MTLRLNGDSSGFTEIKAADAAGDNSIKLPASNGGANQLLKNGSTAGELEYESNVTVDSSGRLCIGNASPDFAKTANIQGSSGSVLMLSSEDTTGIQDTNASIEFRINDGASGRATAEIRAGKESATAGNQNSYISFVTRDTSNRERIRIASNGALKLLADCPGIDFSGIQTNAAGVTSETLDSYEEGTFVPNLVLLTGGTIHQTIAPLNTHYKGRYTKIGHRVWVNLYVRYDLSTITATSWSQALIQLPFVQGNQGGQQYASGSISYLAQFLALPISANSNHFFPGVYVGSSTNYLYPTVNQMDSAESYLTQSYLTRNASAGFMATANYSVESL